VPADILRNRPDVRAAEREFAVATAAVGVADAEALPSLSLSGFIAIGTEDTWSFGPTLFAPVLNQGVLQANRQVAQSNARQSELVWRNSVLNAVEDVQSAMVLTRQWQSQVAAFGRAVAASSEVRDLSLRAFDEGATTFLDVIDAERVIVENQLQQAESIRAWTSSYVQLQVATGKGWLVGVDEIYVINRRGGAGAQIAAFE
jgi:multidrug efflux system outer membrane protein